LPILIFTYTVGCGKIQYSHEYLRKVLKEKQMKKQENLVVPYYALA